MFGLCDINDAFWDVPDISQILWCLWKYFKIHHASCKCRLSSQSESGWRQSVHWVQKVEERSLIDNLSFPSCSGWQRFSYCRIVCQISPCNLCPNVLSLYCLLDLCDTGTSHKFVYMFLASQDAIEVIVSVSESVSQWVTLRTELTDVTLESEDTYWRLY